MFQKTGGKYAEKLETADGKTFIFGKATTVRFSEPVFHGPEDSFLGWVLMTILDYQGEKFMFASDVQGPMLTPTLKIITMEKPQLLMLGGPPLYLAQFKVDKEQIQAGLNNLEKVVEATQCIILEHHILRDENWHEKTKQVFNKAYNTGCKVLTAAEFLGKENAFLEAMRRRLFVENPPSREFEKWMHGNIKTKKHVMPPM